MCLPLLTPQLRTVRAERIQRMGTAALSRRKVVAAVARLVWIMYWIPGFAADLTIAGGEASELIERITGRQASCPSLLKLLLSAAW